MKPDSKFHRLEPVAAGELAAITVDGVALDARAGENLAGAMLVAGVQWFRRSTAGGQARGPWCMMGACYECVVEVDGIVRQACMTEVYDGMKIVRREQMPRLLESDYLETDQPPGEGR